MWQRDDDRIRRLLIMKQPLGQLFSGIMTILE